MSRDRTISRCRMLQGVLGRSLGGLGALATAKFAHCGLDKHSAIAHSTSETERAQQYEAAMKWCQENNKGDYAGAHRVDDKGQKL